MALFISEKDVKALLSITDAMEAVAQVFRLSGEETVLNPPRQCVAMPGGTLRITAAVVPPLERMAVKVSSTLVFKSNSGRLLILSHARTGAILALIEVFHLGALRTGAATGVATDYLARRDARTVGIFGSGRQARTQLMAVSLVRPLERVVAISPNREHLQRFCTEMRTELGIPVMPAKTAEDLYDSSILISATTSKEPVIFGRLLRPGTHVNAIGGNMLERRELDDDAISRFALITVDNKEQAREECGEFVHAVAHAGLSWESVREVGEVVCGKIRARPEPDSVTLYKSLGVAMEDVALASRLYQRAVEKGVGLEVPLTED
jgi:alanine dehydrogenase